MVRPTSRVCRVLVTGPLAPFVDAYRLELRARGYTQRTAVSQLRQLAWLSRWLEAQGLTVAEFNVARMEEFVVVQRASGRNRAGWSRPALMCLLEVLDALGVVAVDEPAVPATATEVLLDRFGHLPVWRTVVMTLDGTAVPR